MTSARRALLAALSGCAALAFAAIGCSRGGATVAGGSAAPVAVAGVVTLDGRPLPNVEVRLVDDDGRFARGLTDSAGRYEMWSEAATPGVKPGPKRVEIRRPGDKTDIAPAAAGALVTTDYILESSDRVIVTAPVTDLDFRLVTTPSGS